ncbi:MAG: NTP transferase domain-containing protein, partial [Terriglobales bacterium]
PMAGRGSRFQKAGIETPKPLLNVSGKPMFVQATNSLPQAGRHIFVCLRESLDQKTEHTIRTNFRDASIVVLDEVTQGQAQTCALGLAMPQPPVDLDSPIMIGACDNGMMVDRIALRDLLENPKVDAIAFTFRKHSSSARNPHMYGWIAVQPGTDKATRVSVKKPISDFPINDHAIVGAFYFRNAGMFLAAFDRMVQNNIRVNGEYYVDSLFGELIEMGMDCRVFEVDSYICWGTPDDWKTFRYWQAFFHKCSWHPYRIERDPTADPDDAELRDLVEYRLTQASR